jgi:hypothetical protein
MSIQGVSNLQAQWAISGQYVNIPTEQLFEWINKSTATSESDLSVLQEKRLSHHFEILFVAVVERYLVVCGIYHKSCVSVGICGRVRFLPVVSVARNFDCVLKWKTDFEPCGQVIWL